MAATGVLIIFSQLCVYPRVDRALGPLAIIQWGSLIAAALTPLMPLASGWSPRGPLDARQV